MRKKKAILLDLVNVVVLPGDYLKKVIYPLIKRDGVWTSHFRDYATGKTSYKIFTFDNDILKDEKKIADSYFLKDGLVDFINSLRKNYDVFLFSDFPAAWYKLIQERENLEGLYDDVFISSELGSIKRDLGTRDFILDKMSSYEKVIFIDDKESNLEFYSEYIDTILVEPQLSFLEILEKIENLI